MFYYTGLKIEFFDLENIKNSEKVFIDNSINKNGLKEIEKQTKIILDFEYANKRFIKNLNGVYILEKVLNKNQIWLFLHYIKGVEVLRFRIMNFELVRFPFSVVCFLNVRRLVAGKKINFKWI